MNAKWARPGTMLAGYGLVAAVFFAPLLSRFRTHILSGDGWIRPGTSDAFNFLWNYWWTQRALGQGRSPFFCDWVLPPAGLNLFFDTHLLVPTVLTWPIAAAFGTTAGYNAMVVALIIAGALGAAHFVQRATGIGAAAAWAAGLFFGFSPYFLNKAHGHLNMIGAAFWVGILGVLLHAYLGRRFTRRGALLLAAACGLTFWTSTVEFFMVSVVATLLVVALEIRPPSGLPPARIRAAFGLPALIVTVLSVIAFRSGGTEPYAPEIFERMRAADVFSFSRLSVLYRVWTSATPEFGGVALPFTGLLLMGIGACRPFRGRGIVLVMLALLGLLMLNPGGLPAAAIAYLPFAEGFRVFPRFFAFFLFFSAVLVGVGVQAVGERARGRWWLVPLTLLALVEIYPAHLAPGEVRGGDLARTAPDLDRSRFLLLFPEGAYLPVHDTYQVHLDLPCVLTSSVAHRSVAGEAERLRSAPLLYDPNVRGSAPEFLAELRSLDVAYLLFENRRAYETGPVRGDAEEWASGELLIRVDALRVSGPRSDD